jgi:hypothetical protein
LKTTDLVAGVRHVWALDKPDVFAVVVYVGAYVASAVIVGAPWVLSVVTTVVAGSVIAFKVYQRARDHREALLFFDWMNDQTPDAH